MTKFGRFFTIALLIWSIAPTASPARDVSLSDVLRAQLEGSAASVAIKVGPEDVLILPEGEYVLGGRSLYIEADHAKIAGTVTIKSFGGRPTQPEKKPPAKQGGQRPGDGQNGGAGLDGESGAKGEPGTNGAPAGLIVLRIKELSGSGRLRVVNDGQDGGDGGVGGDGGRGGPGGNGRNRGGNAFCSNAVSPGNGGRGGDGGLAGIGGPGGQGGAGGQILYSDNLQHFLNQSSAGAPSIELSARAGRGGNQGAPGQPGPPGPPGRGGAGGHCGGGGDNGPSASPGGVPPAETTPPRSGPEGLLQAIK
jgi:hypothetical protein